ncbi:MAG TPA: plastocyanin/azurin family copper-binding protein [Gemmatimonadales bacterium]|nr:plastocyanin/azurin family copper-binding protein [Gemmatimonadales bacterium]
MSLRFAEALLVAGAIAPAAAAAQDLAATAPAPANAHLHLVAMVERGQYGIAFDPQRTAAALGDTVRFVQQGALPHNVMFRSVPSGADLGAAAEGPLLTARGATYDVVLDRRFVPGKYLFVCVPHETMGMAGLLYVEPPEPE